MSGVSLALPAEAIEAIAQRTAEIVLERLRDGGGERPELATVREAAEILRCKPQRIYNLLTEKRLTRVKDHGRTLLIRAELDAHLAGQPTGPLAATVAEVAHLVPTQARDGSESRRSS